MADIITVGGMSIEPRNAAVPARPGSKDIQNILGSLKLVDDQGNVDDIGGGLTPTQLAQLAALPGPWNVVNVPSDTQNLDIVTGLDGDADQAYEVMYVSAAMTQLSSTLTIKVGVDGGASSTTGEEAIQVFGNGSVAASTNQGGFFVADDSSATNGQNPNFLATLYAKRTGLPRIWRASGCRGTATGPAFYLSGGQYQATGNITKLTLSSNNSNGIKAGSFLAWRKIGG
jgi:hypothetical protein